MPDSGAIAVDLPGNGDSGLADHLGYEPKTAAHFLADFTAALGIERSSVVGNSAGGLIAGMTALEYPERVERVALVASAGLGRRVSWPLRLISIPVLGELIYKPSHDQQSGHDQAHLLPSARHPRRNTARDASGALPASLAPQVMLRSVRSGINLLGLRREHHIVDRLRSLPVPAPSGLGRRRPSNPSRQGGRSPARPASQHGPRTPRVRSLASHGKAGRVQPHSH